MPFGLTNTIVFQALAIVVSLSFPAFALAMTKAAGVIIEQHSEVGLNGQGRPAVASHIHQGSLSYLRQ